MVETIVLKPVQDANSLEGEPKSARIVVPIYIVKETPTKLYGKIAVV